MGLNRSATQVFTAQSRFSGIRTPPFARLLSRRGSRHSGQEFKCQPQIGVSVTEPETSLDPIKQISAGELNSNAEAGPPDGAAVLPLHGWPYDIDSYGEIVVAASASHQPCALQCDAPRPHPQHRTPVARRRGQPLLARNVSQNQDLMTADTNLPDRRRRFL